MMLDAIFGPLFEFNPVKYARDPHYRRKCQAHLGKRAARIFRYQIFWALLLLVFATAFTLW
jgi:hypothetical protein